MSRGEMLWGTVGLVALVAVVTPSAAQEMGSALLREGRYEEAQAQLDAFDDLDAPADMQSLVDGIRQEVTDGLTGAASTTTSVPEGGSTTAPASPTPSTTAPG